MGPSDIYRLLGSSVGKSSVTLASSSIKKFITDHIEHVQKGYLFCHAAIDDASLPLQIEADESTFGMLDLGDGVVEFVTYIGLRIRSQNDSLILIKRDPAQCRTRRRKDMGASPPALTKDEWLAIAR
eukprot:2405050-Amphidinium_carterae.1